MKVFKFVAGSGSNTFRAIITAHQWEIDWLVGQEVQFGDENLGKTPVVIEAKHFRVITEDPAEVLTIAGLISSFGDDPFDFLSKTQLDLFDDAARARRQELQTAKVERARETCSTALNETLNR